MSEEYEMKKARLLELADRCTINGTAVAFSGGVDSSLILKIFCRAALKNGTQVYAYTIHTMLHPVEELELTERLAREMGAVHKVIKVDEMSEAGIEDNPVDRCYRCKKCMFMKLKADACAHGADTVIEGTNADDMTVYRPGIKAVRELGIISPLLETGFTKADVRRYAAELGIRVAERPSSPCLATRFPYGTHLTEEGMRRVERLEKGIRDLGFYNVRARVHDSLVRIEVDEKDIDKLVEKRAEVISLAQKEGFDYTVADLEGFRSGSQDIHIQNGGA